MRLMACLGLALLALAPVAHAQGTPPAAPLDLRLSAANQHIAMFFQQPSITWTGRTAKVWIFMALPESNGGLAGGWFQQTVDCTARTIAGSDLWPVTSEFAARPMLADSAKPAQPITSDSMDESISRVLCDGADFRLNKPPAADLQTAWAQAQDLFKSLASSN